MADRALTGPGGLAASIRHVAGTRSGSDGEFGEQLVGSVGHGDRAGGLGG